MSTILTSRKRQHIETWDCDVNQPVRKMSKYILNTESIIIQMNNRIRILEERLHIVTNTLNKYIELEMLRKNELQDCTYIS